MTQGTLGANVAPDDGPVAAYKNFRPTRFYDGVFINGCYTADLMGCNWSCDKCWSRFGGRNDTPKYELTPSQAAHKMVAGMRRNAQQMVRISYGEPGMHWEHVTRVIDEVLARTKDERLVVPGLTGRRGEPFGVLVETNGSLITPARLDDLERRHGKDAARVVLCIGVKATTPEQLAELTGHSIETARRFHRAQLDALFHIAANCKYLMGYAAFLDRYTDPEIYAAIVREVDRCRPAMARHISVLDFKEYAGTTRLYVPKRLRTSDHPDPVPGDDAEAVHDISAPDGPRRRQELTDADDEPTSDPDGEDLLFGRTPPPPPDGRKELAREWARAVDEQDTPAGTMHPRR